MTDGYMTSARVEQLTINVQKLTCLTTGRVAYVRKLAPDRFARMTPEEGEKIERRREALNELTRMSQELPGGYR